MDELEKIILSCKGFRGFLEYKNQRLFFKEASHDGIEMVVEKICKLVDINCANYVEVNYDGKKYYISKDIGNFHSGHDLGLNYYTNNIDDILEEFHRKYKEYDIDIVRMFLYRVYFLDILITNIDRTNGNWGIKTKGNFSCYILDNEAAFWKPIDNIKERNFLTSLREEGTSYDDLENFLSIHPEFSHIFLSMYSELSPIKIAEIFREVELESGISIEDKEEKINMYIDNYDKIGKVINKEEYSLRLFD